MPHLIIEHSNEFNADILMEAVFKGALSSRLFESRAIKVRALPYQHYQVGFKRSAFIHVTLKIISGRTQGQKLGLSEGVIEQLLELGYENVAITAEVVDIDRESYSMALS
ncbi:5-carboxymethyl-2-hydroxymuconate isomerase [Parashewanella curva]|uniref:5-carboxymethyl-2-hydroxymuconate isomerase n=1 Tax=Parashewanella curva TaxID=2338552 RepID=A0A3L8PWL6_9GAMM|nr:5-carboxymethyl-2-hydroxymuconate isomerase [Parashewanella curva]RLV59745.1 5-carboxymethyl-2-hydroxymuconate isomerase [Parashewanella curva]